ncbi:ligand-dependent nuclear receptor-interacting factor 1 [Syngnathus typhle]|uniref:ligand-dependent nuclear receptor-interacting factor 1 n=1 Tax=Syngnathus typhle TaxID=161592 RepID=UPI002A6A6539|nr:ligand-dependent nuclear receptor-interacting factor 1 [Syngnathus typhle]
MYSASRQDNVAQRETGVVYQALPAVGADGKNVMILMPVHVVNGKYYVPSQIVKPTTQGNIVSAPVPIGKKIGVTSLAKKQTVSNLVPLVNPLPCKNRIAGQALELGTSLNTHPLKTIGPQAFINAPKNQVLTVSASKARSGIKNQLPFSSSNSFSSSDSTNVPTISSKTSVSQSSDSSYISELENVCSTSSTTSLSLGPAKSHLQLIPKVSQRPDSPMKWVIEEVNSNESALPNSPPVLSKTYQTLETSNKFGALEKVVPDSLSSLATSETHQQQAMVMCDGRVFFAAEKDALSSPVASRKKKCAPKNSLAPSSSSSLMQHSRMTTSNGPNEVIDLCSDDNPNDVSQTLLMDSSLDEDNVIFVSYIPPKSENAPLQSMAEQTLQNETNRTRTLGHVTEHIRTTLNSSETAHDHLACGSSIDRIQKPDQSVIGSTVANEYSDSVISSHYNSDEQQLDSFEVSRRMDDSGLTSGESTDKEERSSNALPLCRSFDHLLRKNFGVTADVRICLHRINPESSGFGLDKLARNGPTENILNPTNLLKESELFMQYHYNPHGLDRSACPVDVKTAKLAGGESVASSPHAGSMVGYVEPIDEDITISDENDTPSNQDSTSQSLYSAHSNTSRMGRARKRPKCPCCVPGTQGLAVKTGTKVEESQRLTWTRNHTSKRSRR